MSNENSLLKLLRNRPNSWQKGVYSACTANMSVISVVLAKAKECGLCAVIEATANQVDQHGGYTGMTPEDFKNQVYAIAKSLDFPLDDIVLGGDHLGPLTVAGQVEMVAMEYASELIRGYVLAGFTKIHVDTSMKLADDDPNTRLSDQVIARRACELIFVAEKAYQELLQRNPKAQKIAYVYGSEVPIPGGAQGNTEMQVTTVEDFQAMIATFQLQLSEQHLEYIFDQLAGVVVQPGVEERDGECVRYDRSKAANLMQSLIPYAPLVFEGHSSDYQSKTHLRELVNDNVAILKVGPALTFAYREALFALAYIEQRSVEKSKQSKFIDVLEQAMLEQPGKWKPYYVGSDMELLVKRQFSFSDRSRYYLPMPQVQSAIAVLFENLLASPLPLQLVSQFAPIQYRKMIEGTIEQTPMALVEDWIGILIEDYIYAVKQD